ncbi:uncharacterized protein LOC119973973 isoform X1 [Scyliorhinus canicula]|uniref:uncharacterized protein LOC119973973 isoform X1 n=1 Tax=Scyliorhinus canicula TaxID=7830 RepID=UPI0018F42088|nr:uncharacterized protein LOC119973973 isoform X1 [Scyliorhinus canicula]
MERGLYPGEEAQEEGELSSLHVQEALPPASILQEAETADGSDLLLLNVDAPKVGVTAPGGSESAETDAEGGGRGCEGLPQEPVGRTGPAGGEISADVHCLKSGEADGVGAESQGQEPPGSEAAPGPSNPPTEQLAEETKTTRVKYASGQAEVRLLTDKLNCSNCQVELLQLELETERKRSRQQTGRIEELEKEVRSNFALIRVLSDCKSKVEQLEELKQSSQELIFKFKESKETAIHLRERITELEFQQAINEQKIKELMDQLSQCTKTTETKDEVKKQPEELLNHQSLSRVRGQIVHTQNESIHHRRQHVSHFSTPATNISKACIIL